jgi:hypothetical protein
MGFFNNDLAGSTSIQTNTWYHVAFVYDYSLSKQIIYLNGVLDANRSAAPNQGTSGAIVIGKTEETLGLPNYFSGYKDELFYLINSFLFYLVTLMMYH